MVSYTTPLHLFEVLEAFELTLITVIVLIINAIAVLSEDRFLARSSCLPNPSYHRTAPIANSL